MEPMKPKTIRFNRWELYQLSLTARQTGRTFSEVVREALDYYIESGQARLEREIRRG